MRTHYVLIDDESVQASSLAGLDVEHFRVIVFVGASQNKLTFDTAAAVQIMHPLIQIHRAELLALARRRGVTGVSVFGSMSRGDASDTSDIDLLVTLAPGTSALALGGLLMDAQDLLGRRVDVVTEASLHPALRERVMAGAVSL